VGRPFVLSGPVAADVAEAETAIARLNSRVEALVDTEALARLLLRAESMASSWIEGLEVGGRRLLRAEAARALGESPGDITAEEVLGNIDAMAWAVARVADAPSISVSDLLEAHRRLLTGTHLQEYAGTIRDQQNWIGGSSYNPCRAAFVPPPHDHVPALLEDLCDFCDGDDLPPVAQAAIAYAQFETIHPFIDGNGRIGRALIHVILRRRGLAPRVLPPVSLVLATWSEDYVRGLTATRYVGSPDGTAARAGLNEWIGVFAAACRRAVDDALDFEDRVREIQDEWREMLGRIRADSATALLLSALPGAPVLTVKTASAVIGRSYPQTNEAVRRLEEAGVLRRTTVGRRNRGFEAPAILQAFTALERQLASPGGDTWMSRPSRRVPARPSA
jgi:Fic family protein